MADEIRLDFGQSIQAHSGAWYKNLHVLGAGGSAVTFLMVATSGPYKGVPFAVKVFRRFSRPERHEQFLNEIKFLKECNHPVIMRVFDEGIFYGQAPFVIAEYLPRTLHSVIRADNVTTPEKASYALQLLSALAYLADLPKPVVHRDIKPQNIFIKGRSCVLGDFGLMKFVGAEQEQDREAYKESVGAGMPWRYRTPDLVRYLKGGPPPTCVSDVFQLGLVLAELFTGRNPQAPAQNFGAEIEIEAVGHVRGAQGPGVANLIQRMLEPEPRERDPAAKFLDPWQGVFFAAAKQAHALEDRVF